MIRHSKTANNATTTLITILQQADLMIKLCDLFKYEIELLVIRQLCKSLRWIRLDFTNCKGFFQCTPDQIRELMEIGLVGYRFNIKHPHCDQKIHNYPLLSGQYNFSHIVDLMFEHRFFKNIDSIRVSRRCRDSIRVINNTMDLCTTLKKVSFWYFSSKYFFFIDGFENGPRDDESVILLDRTNLQSITLSRCTDDYPDNEDNILDYFPLCLQEISMFQSQNLMGLFDRFQWLASLELSKCRVQDFYVVCGIPLLKELTIQLAYMESFFGLKMCARLEVLDIRGTETESTTLDNEARLAPSLKLVKIEGFPKDRMGLYPISTVLQYFMDGQIGARSIYTIHTYMKTGWKSNLKTVDWTFLTVFSSIDN